MTSQLKSLFVILRRYIRSVRLLGLTGVGIVLRSLLGSTAEVTCRVSGTDVLVRLNSSDLDTLLQIFHQAEYDVVEPDDPRWIIDAGANVGYAAVYFAQRFPNAKILALEPALENFAQLEKHAARYPSIVPIQAALWVEDGTIELRDPGEGAWGFRVGAGNAGEVVDRTPAVSVASLLEQFTIPRVDLLKVDIEGSEVEVFAAASDWIDRVDMIVAELHDKYRTGCARAFYGATGGFSTELRSGENVILIR